MKQPEVKEASTEDLKDALNKSRKSYGELRMAHAMTPLDNPLQIRKERRTIARILTELSVRESN